MEEIFEILGEETTEKKMNKEEIIENYIEHVRNISELTDDEIMSVMDEAIEEDDQLLRTLEKFLSKRENIREKLVKIQVIDEEIGDEKDEDKDEDKDEKRQGIDAILETIEDADYAYPLEDIMKSLKKSGYVDPGTIITEAIGDMNILYVDSIDKDGVLYLALTKEGDTLWEVRNH